MHKLKIIDNKNTWNNFIINSGFKFYSFVDSWEWWEFNKLEWQEVYRYWIFENDENLVWVFQLIKIKAKRATYMFTPHGPLILWDYFAVLEEIKKELIEIAKIHKLSFIRLNSVQENTKENKHLYSEAWFIDAPMHVHAEDTHLLDLTLSEEQLLKNMRQTTRYTINRAIKEWVKVELDYSEKSIDNLIELHQKHAKRTNGKNNYHAFKDSYIKNLFKVFDKDSISIMNAIYDWFVEATLITIKFWETCVYYIWASEIKNPKFSPAYLLQWEAIRRAKNNWCKIYNFWGVSPDDNPKHPIQWVSLFKRWFGWYDYYLLHAQDLIISSKYWINFSIESIRRVKRWYYYKKPE